MLVKDFITKEIPVLKSLDTGRYALSLMDDYKIRHLPVVHEDTRTYHSVVSEKWLLSAGDLFLTLAQLKPAENWSIKPDDSLLNAVAIMAQNKLSLLPVISEDNEYIGVLTQEYVFNALSEYTQAEANGSIIILEIRPMDYSISEIARIIESNNTHLLSLMSAVSMQNDSLHIILKIDSEDASAVIRSFERYNYIVSGYTTKEGIADETFRQRVNEFIHYINI